jgi:hypothetical protein
MQIMMAFRITFPFEKKIHRYAGPLASLRRHATKIREATEIQFSVVIPGARRMPVVGVTHVEQEDLSFGRLRAFSD